MSTKLEAGSSLKREIRVAGLEQPILVEITSNGLSFWAKGSRKRVSTSWLSAVRAGVTGNDVPSYLKDHPVELLTHYMGRDK